MPTPPTTDPTAEDVPVEDTPDEEFAFQVAGTNALRERAGLPPLTEQEIAAFRPPLQAATYVEADHPRSATHDTHAGEWVRKGNVDIATFNPSRDEDGEPRLTREQVAQMFTSDAAAALGLRTRVSVHSDGPNTTTISAKWLNEDGDEVGAALREIRWEYGYAKHHVMELHPSIQGQGIGSDMMRGHVRTYDAVGLDTVLVDAGGVNGRYTWARMGFDFAIDEREPYREAYEQTLNDLIDGTAARPVSALARDEMHLLIGAAQTPNDLATLTFPVEDYVLTGKQVMLSTEADWRGKLDLTHGTPSRRRLDEYLAG